MCVWEKGPCMSQFIKWKGKLDWYEWMENDKRFCFAKGQTSQGFSLFSLLKSKVGIVFQRTCILDVDRCPNLLHQSL